MKGRHSKNKTVFGKVYTKAIDNLMYNLLSVHSFVHLAVSAKKAITMANIALSEFFDIERRLPLVDTFKIL